MSAGTGRARLDLLDTLRGLCLVSMVCYHAMYDLVDIRGVPVPWFWDAPGYVWQQSVCWGFILLSGVCARFSRHHLYQAFLLLFCGEGVSLATALFMPDQAIRCGVLTLLGLCPLFLWLFSALSRRLGVRLPDGAGLLLCALLFFLTRDLPQGSLGFEGLRLFDLPAALYRTDALAFLGFPSPEFFSTDYFPLLPWFFLYLSGYFLWGLLSQSEKVLAACRRGITPLSFLGRHSLFIYLAHQPVLLAVFLLLPQGA